MKKGIKDLAKWALVGLFVVLVAGLYTGKIQLPTLGGTGTLAGSSPGTTNVVVASSSGITLTWTGTDRLKPGTSISPSARVSANGGPFQAATASGASTFTAGHNLKLLFNVSGYHPVVVDAGVVPTQGPMVVPVTMLANASITITGKNTNGEVMVVNGGATNQSVSTDSSANMEIRFDGQGYKGTGPMLCVLEASDSTSIQELTLNGNGASFRGREKPASYTLAGTGSAIWVYDVPSIEGSVSPTYIVGMTSKSGQDASGDYFIISCMTKESFIDSVTGQLVQDAIEDSAGTAQHLAKYSAKYYFN